MSTKLLRRQPVAYSRTVGYDDQQTADMSWWPQQSAWEISGLNVGHWTPDCEDWFRNRLQSIHQGTATLRSASDWKKAMKLQRKAVKVAATNRDQACRFLNTGHF